MTVKIFTLIMQYEIKKIIIKKKLTITITLHTTIAQPWAENQHILYTFFFGAHMYAVGSLSTSITHRLQKLFSLAFLLVLFAFELSWI